MGSFGELLLARVFLGGVTAAAGPMVASLVGDYFPASERGRIYGYILGGELIGAGVGFAVTGDIAALSWRAAFVILSIPAFVLAWFGARLWLRSERWRSPLGYGTIAIAVFLATALSNIVSSTTSDEFTFRVTGTLMSLLAGLVLSVWFSPHRWERIG